MRRVVFFITLRHNQKISMRKIQTFIRYSIDYLKFGEFYFFWMSIKYVLTRRINPEQRIYKSSLGTFLTRKGTLDFQFANYAYEWNVKRFFLDHYKGYNVFLDIGSNIGTYCFLVAPKGLRCFAFEPVKENFDAIQSNIALNKMDKEITAFNFGLGTEETEAEFIFENMNTGASHLAKIDTYAENKGETGIREIVAIKTLDSVFDQMGIGIDDKVLVKIDAEGMELDVLRGAKSFLCHYPAFLIIIETKHSEFITIESYIRTLCDIESQIIDSANMAIFKGGVKVR